MRQLRGSQFFLVGLVLTMSITGCQPQNPNTMRFFVGTYSTPDTPDIYCCEVNLKDKKMKVLNATFGIENPSFLALSPDKKHLYAVSETDHFDDRKTGGVFAYQIRQARLGLRELNSVSSEGAHPCQLSVHPSGQYLFVANYSGGNITSLGIKSDGSLSGSVQSVQHMGSGPVSGRQDKAHAHSANISTSGSFLYAADLGIDKIMGYQISYEAGTMRHFDNGTVDLAPGTGPRHMAFHPNQQTAFVVNELNSTVTICRMNPETGALDTLSSVSTLPPNFVEENYCADIHVHPSGEYLYVSNRGHNSIAVFKIVISSGKQPELRMIQTMPTLGDWPRNFALSPDGHYLMVANQNSGNIVLLEINQDNGLLKDIGIMAKIPQPVCIVFYP